MFFLVLLQFSYPHLILFTCDDNVAVLHPVEERQVRIIEALKLLPSHPLHLARRALRGRAGRLPVNSLIHLAILAPNFVARLVDVKAAPVQILDECAIHRLIDSSPVEVLARLEAAPRMTDRFQLQLTFAYILLAFPHLQLEFVSRSY